jgi:hypothetical protein
MTPLHENGKQEKKRISPRRRKDTKKIFFLFLKAKLNLNSVPLRLRGEKFSF